MSPSSRTDLIGSKALQPADTSPSRLLLIILNLLSYEKSVESPGQANSTLSCPALPCPTLPDRPPPARPPARSPIRPTDRPIDPNRARRHHREQCSCHYNSIYEEGLPSIPSPTDRPTDPTATIQSTIAPR